MQQVLQKKKEGDCQSNNKELDLKREMRKRERERERE